jgi:hypothetical protein
MGALRRTLTHCTSPLPRRLLCDATAVLTIPTLQICVPKETPAATPLTLSICIPQLVMFWSFKSALSALAYTEYPEGIPTLLNVSEFVHSL